MRLIMMGTGPFAVPTFERLYESRHEVLALVTRPPRALHGKSAAEANPMRELAASRGTPVHAPESINAPAARAELITYRPDLFVVCDYGQILSADVLAISRLGGINLHASLLPKYRGAAPINWAIYHGEGETGVTVIHMTRQLDAGPAIVQLQTPIGVEETAAEAEPRLAELGAPAVLSAIDLLEAGTAIPLPQDPGQATKAPRLNKSDGQVDWSRPAAAIKNQVRALVPWPKTFTFWRRGEQQPLRLILEKVQFDNAAHAASPGTILEANGDILRVATGAGTLAIQSIQPAGKRILTTAEFLRGYPVQPGDQFST
ncbi:MAG TPA: methionyl-tRNA formyltransferase [Pirellulales bacterium]|nr:methionyl-tRNA formyltransferase [Pirellulales bacterium]